MRYPCSGSVPCPQARCEPRRQRARRPFSAAFRRQAISAAPIDDVPHEYGVMPGKLGIAIADGARSMRERVPRSRSTHARIAGSICACNASRRSSACRRSETWVTSGIASEDGDLFVQPFKPHDAHMPPARHDRRLPVERPPRESAYAAWQRTAMPAPFWARRPTVQEPNSPQRMSTRLARCPPVSWCSAAMLAASHPPFRPRPDSRAPGTRHKRESIRVGPPARREEQLARRQHSRPPRWKNAQNLHTTRTGMRYISPDGAQGR